MPCYGRNPIHALTSLISFKDVVVVQRGTWKKQYSLKDENGMVRCAVHSPFTFFTKLTWSDIQDITTLQWSPTGLYLAATDINGHLSIWNVNQKTTPVIRYALTPMACAFFTLNPEPPLLSIANTTKPASQASHGTPNKTTSASPTP